ncbi:hypothetical protein D3C85_1649060 [compost metagenome]
MEAAEILPYSVVNWLALSPTCWSIARRSLASSSNRPLASAMRNTRFSTPCWVSLSSSIRDSSSGPMCETVARTGCPFSPKTSQSVVGQAPQAGSGSPCSARRALSLSEGLPT